jgi:hypothetical protein
LADAERVLREAVCMPGAGTYTQASLGYALAMSGQRDEAESILASLEAHAKVGYVSPVAFATIHVGLGNIDRTLDWAERALDDRRGWVAYLRVNPLMDPLRSHPRFETLVGRLNLP